MDEARAATELPAGWWYVDGTLAATLEQQLAKELLPGHPVTGRCLKAIAKCDRNDDVLFVEPDGDRDPVYWLIHLTWSRAVDPRWPDAAIVNVPDGLRSPFDDV